MSRDDGIKVGDEIIGITREYFDSEHHLNRELSEKIEMIFHENPMDFLMIIFSLVTKIGCEYPLFRTVICRIWFLDVMKQKGEVNE